MKIFTTINPNGNFDVQLEAMNSWSNKYEVYSVNAKEEIEKISSIYTNVKFIETDITYQYNNKKLIKLNSILSAIESMCKNCDVAIVNSDIILNDKIKESIFNKKNDGLTIATRYELDGDDIYPFTNGYDIFIFNTKYLDLFKNDNYVIGMPWWDFWIPLVAIKAGLKVYHIKNKVIFHRTHPTNYDGNIWITFGEHLYKDIMIGLMKNPMSVSVYDFCIGVKAFIEKKQINIKLK